MLNKLLAEGWELCFIMLDNREKCVAFFSKAAVDLLVLVFMYHLAYIFGTKIILFCMSLKLLLCIDESLKIT